MQTELPEETREDNFIEKHLKAIDLLNRLYGGKKFFVECFPTDPGAMCFPNSNFAVKEVAKEALEIHSNLQMRKLLTAEATRAQVLINALSDIASGKVLPQLIAKTALNEYNKPTQP